ncbi:MAG: hemerythrin domain-containing protein [Bacteroidia bacterium]|nr:hemerythrin domain-containing protein [Bacteroidia bacterium]
MSNRKKYVSELLMENHRYAAVMFQHGIDFFDHLDQTLDEVCRTKQVSVDKIYDQLARTEVLFRHMEEDFRHHSPRRLCSYLQRSHHNYSQVMLPIIQHHIERTARHYGKEYPHLHLLSNIFDTFRRDFLVHIGYENKVVFPYIKKLEHHTMQFAHNFLLQVKEFTLDTFILRHAHDDDDMLLIRSLTNQFKTDSNDHIAYRILIKELEDFEQDLKLHSLIEEKILIPKAQKLEQLLKKKVQEMVRMN